MSTFIIFLSACLLILLIVVQSLKDSKNIDSFDDYKPINSTYQKTINSEYKRKYIKKFDLVGAYYRNLRPDVDSGKFIGYIAHDYMNKYDDYALAVYNEFETHLGYLPKRNKKLFYHMENNTVIRLPAWGEVYYDNYDKSWAGDVNVPLGYAADELKMFVQIIDYSEGIDELKIKKEKSLNEYMELLEHHGHIKHLLSLLGNPKNHFYKFPKSLVPQISSHFEKNECWEELILLNEKYNDLVISLSEKFKNSTLRRIEKAYKNIKTKPHV